MAKRTGSIDDGTCHVNQMDSGVRTVKGEKVCSGKLLQRVLITFVVLLGLVLLLTLLIIVFKHDNLSGIVLRPQETEHFENPGDSSNFTSSGQLRFIDRNSWLAQPPTGKLDPLRVPVPYVIISHTASEPCFTQADCVLRVRIVQSFHVDSKKWSDIGYNFLVGGDGFVYVGRGWDKVGAHALGYNYESIGISFIGSFVNVSPLERQITAAQQLIKVGVELGKVAKDYKLLAHLQVSSTQSPGIYLYNEMKKWPHWAEKP